MLEKKEFKCLNLIVDLLKNSSKFRPLSIEKPDTHLLPDMDETKVFALFKGSYMAKSISIGISLNYNIVELDTSSTVALFYVVPCKPGFAAIITRETAADRITKEIGLKIEIEVDNKIIDDGYLINSNNREILTGLANEHPLETFLKSHINDLELLHIKEEELGFRRAFKPNEDTVKTIEADINNLLDVAKAMEEYPKNRG
ncbi:MAG: hypothetical protein K8T10_19550 [Candidatus Eremiobacteraeota bacterium]|nr:hypothetical protein [Candidatus Eremiobacteraeota bacterium]